MPRRWWQIARARPEPPPVADPLWRRALAGCALARGLEPERQRRLRQLSTYFLAQKTFHALAGAVLDDYWRLLIAMQACLPALHQGASSLRGWREVLVYPGEFKVRGNQHVCQSITMHAGDDRRNAEIWQGDPLVLSLADVQLDLEQPWDGCNVVLHEMAHKLDRLDGPADGVPPLADISRRRWISQFEEAYCRLANTPATDQGPPIAPHAAENASEYFATVTELHYSQPGLLRAAEPAIAELLNAFYGNSPAIECDVLDCNCQR